ncbi:MAG: uracil-DNA glycosylase [Thiotrichaceae bacterium]|nr:uracil-DNA glycosylase [Thiotrichaceae bacterium]
MQAALSDYHRHLYLKALGIPVWIDRSDDIAEPVPIDIEGSKTATQSLKHINTQIPRHIQTMDNDASITPSITPKPKVKVGVKTTPVNCSHTNWSDLSAMVQSCQHCALYDSRRQAILGSGNLTACCMIISDMPSEEDDIKGHLFMGKSGFLLNNMLKAISLERNAVYIAATTKCRTPVNRSPEPIEQQQCRAYLEQQIRLIKPQAILVMGRIASQALLQQKLPITQLRGQVHSLTLDKESTNIPVVATLHPRNLLLQPKNKAKAWQDLKRLATLLDPIND